MNKKRQNAIYTVFLLVMLIVSGFFNGIGCDNSEKTNPDSSSNAVNDPHAVKKNNDSEPYANQLRASHDYRALLYHNLETHFGKYWTIKRQLGDIEKAYEENQSSINLERLDAFTLEGQKTLEKIEALKEEIEHVENEVIPMVKSRLSEDASDDSNFTETFAKINGIKSKLNQFLGQYPEIDAIIGDTLK